MKKALKVVAVAIAIIVIWAGMLAFYLLNWYDINARQIAVQYSKIGYPQGCIVLAGSSTMQVWKNSASDLGPLETVNVGISGTVVSNWLRYTEDLIIPFNPKAVVLYIGANDLHNDETAPADVFAALQTLFDQIIGRLPQTRIYFVSIYTTADRPDKMADDLELNRLVEAYADAKPYLRYIDCATPLLAADGSLRDDIFLSDNVHLNDTGYAIFSRELRRVLLADFPVV